MDTLNAIMKPAGSDRLAMLRFVLARTLSTEARRATGLRLGRDVPVCWTADPDLYLGRFGGHSDRADLSVLAWLNVQLLDRLWAEEWATVPEEEALLTLVVRQQGVDHGFWDLAWRFALQQDLPAPVFPRVYPWESTNPRVFSLAASQTWVAVVTAYRMEVDTLKECRAGVTQQRHPGSWVPSPAIAPTPPRGLLLALREIPPDGGAEVAVPEDQDLDGADDQDDAEVDVPDVQDGGDDEGAEQAAGTPGGRHGQSPSGPRPLSMVGPPAVPLPFLLPPPPTTTADPPPGAVEFKTFGDRFQEYRDAHPEATENDLEDAAHRFADEIECEEQDYYELQTRLDGLDIGPPSLAAAGQEETPSWFPPH